MASDHGVAELCAESNPTRSHEELVSLFTGSRSRPWDGVGPKALELAHLWGDAVLEVRHLDSGVLRLGSRAGALRIPPADLPSDDFQLFSFEGDAVFCTFSELWGGSVSDGAASRSLKDVGASAGLGLRRMELRAGACLALDIGPATLVARLVSRAQRLPATAPKLDKPFLGIGSMNAFLGAMIAVLALTQSPDPRAETELDPSFYLDLIPVKPVEPTVPEEVKKQEAGGEKAKREEGRAGERTAKLKEARGERRTEKQIDREIAESAGVLGALSDDAALSDALANTNAALMKGVGGLIGVQGTQMGPGLGNRGGGLGGGGHTDGLSDGEGPGTRGRKSGYGEPTGPETPKGDGVLPGNDVMIFSTAIDRSQIDAVIRRNISRFRYCYQRQLTRDPTLSGKVVVKFSIARDGSVSVAETKASTLGNADAESCMNTVMRGLTFPEPRGGGVVIVSYPFLFAPG